jgi:hypothetical protein
MKTFAELMEQIPRMEPTSKSEIAQLQANARTTRQHNRYAHLQRLHTTMHLNQTAEKEEKAKKDAYNA